MLILDAAAVRSLLTPQVAFEAVARAFRDLRSPTTYQPVRTVVSAPSIPGLTLMKPAACDGAYGMKIASVFPDNPQRGIATVQGFVVLLNPQTGTLEALLDAAALTEIRTAAASALATALLARPDAHRLGLLGTGVQARSHLLALRQVRSLSEVSVWSPRGGHAFCAWACSLGLDVKAAASAEEVVRSSDLICTLTTSPTPVLLGDWVAPGTHVNAVGAFLPDKRELDSAAVAASMVVVDMREAAAAEAGALLLAEQAGDIGPNHVAAELSEVLRGEHPGRMSDQDVTLFSSTGLAVQDVAAAKAAIAAARLAGLGHEVPFP